MRTPEEALKVIRTYQRVAKRGGLSSGFARELIEGERKMIKEPGLKFGPAEKEQTTDGD